MKIHFISFTVVDQDFVWYSSGVHDVNGSYYCKLNLNLLGLKGCLVQNQQFRYQSTRNVQTSIWCAIILGLKVFSITWILSDVTYLDAIWS